MKKAPSPRAISYRGTINRPWLTRTLHDRLCRDSVMHVDLYAYWPALFVIEYRQAGKLLVARDLLDASLGVLVPAALPEPLPPVMYWTADNHKLFAPVHAALMARERAREPQLWESSTTLLCHYVRALDANPWPRGAINSFKGRAKRRHGVIGKTD